MIGMNYESGVKVRTTEPCMVVFLLSVNYANIVGNHNIVETLLLEGAKDVVPVAASSVGLFDMRPSSRAEQTPSQIITTRHPLPKRTVSEQPKKENEIHRVQLKYLPLSSLYMK